MRIFALIFALLFIAVLGSNSMEIEERNPTRQQCSQQLQQQQQLDSCQRYLVKSSHPISGSNPLQNLGEDEERSWREEFMRCCPQLEKLEEKCRCEGIRRIVEREQQKGELRGEQMKEMFLTAKTLPALCGNLPPGRCNLISISI